MSFQVSRARKRELRELNKLAWEGKKDVFKCASSLDTSLRKNTAVIKRLRTSITAESQQSLLKDIQSTSLEKYLPEVISAVDEGLRKSKIPDGGAIVEVVSALHQRFQLDFTPKLTYALAKGLANPRAEALKGLSAEQKEREEKERLARQRSLLRVSTELWLVGVIRSVQDATSTDELAAKGSTAKIATATVKEGRKKEDGEAEPFPLEVLKELLGRDREHINLPLVVLFAKQFAFDVLGITPKNTARKTVEEDGATTTAEPSDKVNGEHVNGNTMDPEEEPLTPPDLQQRFKNVLTRYLDSVKAHIVRQHEYLQSQSARNAEAYIKSGEIFEDRQANYEKLVKVQDKFVANAQTIADILGVEMPDLQEEKNEDPKDSIIREGGSMFTAKGEEGRSGIWEDDDQRRFYEDIIDLKLRVPPILLEDKKKKKDGEAKTDEEKKKSGEEEDGDTTKEESAAINNDTRGGADGADEDATTDDPASTAIVNKSVGAQVDALLIRLPDFTNRDLIDQAAVDFCFLNSKASRNRLIRVLQDVPRSRQDLLPYYSRLIATLNRYLPDIGKAMVDHLDKEFRGLQHRKEKDLSESRARNARYLSELTKFGVVPQHVIFHCLKVALDDFHRINIDIICHILENCGRYLLRTQETSGRMATFLDTLKKKKDGVTYLGPQERVVIENAFYYVNPPDRPAIAQKERSIMELFVRKLIYLDLTKRNYVKILKQLRKLHWEDPSVVNMLMKIFTKVWKVRYNNIHILAIIVGALSRYHQEFAYGVIDEVLDQVTRGLEENNFKHSQRRIALVKYLGELYNYKMVDSPVIFDALYRIVTFGHEGGMPKPGVYCPLDPPDEYFRIRLVCTLLDCCGTCFDRGSAKKKLDFFLTFFQYYFYTKEVAPMDIDFLVQDTLALLRPTWKWQPNLEEAGKAFQEAVSKTYKPTDDDKTEVEDIDDGDSWSDGGEDVDRDEEIEAREGAISDGEDEEGGVAAERLSDETSETSSSEEEESIVVNKRAEHIDPEAEADFDREFAKMMQESLESRKFERKPVFDVPLPIRKGSTLSMLSREPTMESENGDFIPPPQPEQKGTMMFSLLTKRGNRQQTKQVALPDDSGFAVAMRNKQEAEREEKQKIKQLVMNYDRLDDATTSEMDALDKHAALNGFHVKMDKSAQKAPRSRKLSMSDVNWYHPGQNKTIRSTRYRSNLGRAGKGAPLERQKRGSCLTSPLEGDGDGADAAYS